MVYRPELYGLLQALAIFVAVALMEWSLRRKGDSLLQRPLVVGAAMLGAGIGGRVHYIIEGLAMGWLPAERVKTFLSPMEGGSTFFGAMLGVVAAFLLLRRQLPFGSFLRFADETVWGLGFAILIGRIGCLFQGCCVGFPCELPWAQSAPDGNPLMEAGTRVHPFVAYLGLWGLISAWLANRAWLQKMFVSAAGNRFYSFIAIFCSGRALLEFFRLSPPRMLGPLNLAQWESLILTAIALLVLSRRRDSRAASHS